MIRLKEKQDIRKYKELMLYADFTSLRKLCLEPFVNQTILKVYISILDREHILFTSLEDLSSYIEVSLVATANAVKKLKANGYIIKFNGVYRIADDTFTHLAMKDEGIENRAYMLKRKGFKASKVAEILQCDLNEVVSFFNFLDNYNSEAYNDN